MLATANAARERIVSPAETAMHIFEHRFGILNEISSAESLPISKSTLARLRGAGRRNQLHLLQRDALPPLAAIAEGAVGGGEAGLPAERRDRGVCRPGHLFTFTAPNSKKRVERG